MEKHEIKTLIEDVVAGNKTADDVADLLLEMSRSDRIYVVDENLLGLDDELIRLRYTVYTLPKGMNDEEIKRQVSGRVLITGNGQHFVKDVVLLRYGLIWVQNVCDYKTLAKRIENAIMQAGFKRNLAQVVKV